MYIYGYLVLVSMVTVCFAVCVQGWLGFEVVCCF